VRKIPRNLNWNILEPSSQKNVKIIHEIRIKPSGKEKDCVLENHQFSSMISSFDTSIQFGHFPAGSE
jgi:hypothetical protein